MANTARAVISTIHQLGAKVTPTHTLTVIITVAALTAATLFWIATLDGVAAVGWYRLAVTVVYIGASLAWIIKLRTDLCMVKHRNRLLERRLMMVEAQHDVLLEDAHIRKVIVEARKSGRLLPVAAEDN